MIVDLDKARAKKFGAGMKMDTEPELWLVHYLNRTSGDLHMTLHSSLAAAAAAYEARLRRFGFEPLPPKEEWSALCDAHGEYVHLYSIISDASEPALLVDIAEALEV